MSDSAGIVAFKQAVRKGSHILIALEGESGSGKTLGGLMLARGLAGPEGKIGVIDTETERALVYADDARVAPWMHADLTYPYTPERYIEALRLAEQAGIDVLLIDSASHEWEGIGGVIDIAEEVGESGKSKDGLVKWARPKQRHKKFMQALLSTRMHIIVCLRAKEKMVQQINAETKRKEIISAGFIPVQDKRFAFEMTVRLFLSNEDGKENKGKYIIKKCPDSLLHAFNDGDRLTIETGRLVGEWVRGGKPIDNGTHDLRQGALEAADEGMAALTAWHKTNAKNPLLARLWNDEGANLKSIATTADAEKSAQADEETGKNPFFKQAQPEQEKDAFGLPPIKEDAAQKVAPHMIGIRTEGSQIDYSGWGVEFDQAIRGARNIDELDAWVKLNDAPLARVAQANADIHKFVIANIKTRRDALAPKSLL